MTEIREQESGNSGLVLVKKPMRSVGVGDAVVREGTTGQMVSMLPRVWAVAAAHARKPEPQVPHAAGTARPKVELAFYRKYTEALLRRYARLSRESGRTPSLLGREMFRGHVTSCRVSGFDDVVIFCHDVERCMAGLDDDARELVKRVAVQEYTQAEAAAAMGLCLRTVVTQYGRALDQLTGMFAERKMLEPLKGCQ